ncbi:hypothetical protein R3P38DRAFT_2785775 [Favolaschia claudopus]|uniref:Uncharacterized protein n=1 Tax=Favolaschia claudopus TaxID=2862362 RepID=A0AAW0AV65_9AGAR
MSRNVASASQTCVVFLRCESSQIVDTLERRMRKNLATEGELTRALDPEQHDERRETERGRNVSDKRTVSAEKGRRATEMVGDKEDSTLTTAREGGRRRDSTRQRRRERSLVSAHGGEAAPDATGENSTSHQTEPLVVVFNANRICGDVGREGNCSSSDSPGGSSEERRWVEDEDGLIVYEFLSDVAGERKTAPATQNTASVVSTFNETEASAESYSAKLTYCVGQTIAQRRADEYSFLPSYPRYPSSQPQPVLEALNLKVSFDGRKLLRADGSAEEVVVEGDKNERLATSTTAWESVAAMRRQRGRGR